MRNDRNRKGWCVACYITSNICYSRKTCPSDNLENIFIDLLFPKTKPISVGIFCKPPSQTRFLEQIITEFESLELINELYIFGDFNINLLFKGALEGLRRFFTTESPLKIMKNAFYFTLKALFVLKIFQFVLTFWSCIKTVWLERSG